MRSFLQGEFAGLRSRWLRVLALLTCLGMALVVAEQQRAIETQSSLIAALSGDRNQAKLKDQKEPRTSVYITDWHIVEPVSKAPAQPEPARPTSPARLQKQI